MLEAEELCQIVSFTSVSRERSTHTIYTFITYKSKRGYLERKSLDRFSITQHTYLLERESYLSLVRNHGSLFSFLLSLLYIKRRFVLKHNLHLFRVQRVFLRLGSFGDLPKETNEAQRMQSDGLWDSKSQRRHDSKKFVGSRSLEGLSTLGRLGFESLLLFVYSNFILQWIDFDLDSCREVFSRVFRFPLQ